MEVPWHGCVDHILELTTGKAFSDTDTTAVAMSQARALVCHFSMSTQATERLQNVQAGQVGNRVPKSHC